MFDSIKELIKKIQLGEDSLLELKSVNIQGDKIKTPDRKDLADEFAAFGNSHNGVLVLGVDDKTKEIIGIPEESLDLVEAFVREICNDSINPPLNVRIIKMMLPDLQGIDQPIIKVDILKSLFVHKSPHGYFYRQGSSKREMKPEYLARLFQQRSQVRLIRFEEQAVPQTSIYDLSLELCHRFTSKSDEPDNVVLLKRNLLAKQEDNTICASVAGILLCSKNPEKFLPNAFIEAVRYKGIKQDSNYQIDSLQIKGPLDEQIKQSMAFLKKNQAITVTKKPQKIESPQFSEKAVFEAIVNAVAHRDYSIYVSKIRFFMFDNRLEIYSPGALPNTVTIESIALRQATRNELITSLLAECPNKENLKDNTKRAYFMEKRGDGVPIIMDEGEKISGIKPVYKLIDDSELLLTIYSKIQD